MSALRLMTMMLGVLAITFVAWSYINLDIRRYLGDQMPAIFLWFGLPLLGVVIGGLLMGLIVPTQPDNQ